jgi:hypothetical protein
MVPAGGLLRSAGRSSAEDTEEAGMPLVGIAHLTILDTAPPDWVSLAHEAGFDAVGIRAKAERIGAWPGEEPGQLFLVLGQDVDRERARPADHLLQRLLIDWSQGCSAVIDYLVSLRSSLPSLPRPGPGRSVQR